MEIKKHSEIYVVKASDHRIIGIFDDYTLAEMCRNIFAWVEDCDPQLVTIGDYYLYHQPMEWRKCYTVVVDENGEEISRNETIVPVTSPSNHAPPSPKMAEDGKTAQGWSYERYSGAYTDAKGILEELGDLWKRTKGKV
jgi:hypothetical protein